MREDGDVSHPRIRWIAMDPEDRVHRVAQRREGNIQPQMNTDEHRWGERRRIFPDLLESRENQVALGLMRENDGSTPNYLVALLVRFGLSPNRTRTISLSSLCPLCPLSSGSIAIQRIRGCETSLMQGEASC